MENDQYRKIIHIDMDAFFTSVEQRDFPEYRNKPIAVGGSKERGVVAAASYEARKYGVRSAMPSKRALKQCPHIIFLKPRMDVYQSVSRQIMTLFREYTDLVEPLSLDEAYLDVTHNKTQIPYATEIARELKKQIKTETGLTASAGVSINKFLAKVASDIQKPDGLTVIPPKKVDSFINTLPIEKFFGVGKVTAKKMKSLRIYTGQDLKKLDETYLLQKFGKAGLYYFNIVHGRDNRPVVSGRTRKSYGAERTFETDIDDKNIMLEKLAGIVSRVCRRMEKSQVKGKTITLKIKFFNFKIQTRSRTVHRFTNSEEEILKLITELFHQPSPPEEPVRLLGISLSNLDNGEECKMPMQLVFDF